jgi:hypothetical protein
LPEADFFVGFVGRLLPQKNLHGFIRIAEAVQQRVTPRQLGVIIVGNYWIDYPFLAYSSGQYDEVIRKVISSSSLNTRTVQLPGRLSDESLRLIYNAIDLLIHPTQSLDENFGYVPLEAMACGTPVLATAYGGIRDSVLPGKTGWLMPTWISETGLRMDYVAGIDFAERFLCDSTLRQRMGIWSIEHVQSGYTFDRFQAMLVAIVHAAIAEPAEGAAPASQARQASMWSLRGELPAIPEPWEKYETVVTFYVSNNAPVVKVGSRLALAAPLIRTSGRITLDDPTWPAICRVSDLEMAMLSALEPYGRIRAVEHRDKRQIPLLQRLVARGLIVCSDAGEGGRLNADGSVPIKRHRAVGQSTGNRRRPDR